LATNVAESSLTVPGIRYVIDTGTARVSRFAAKSRVQRLPIEPICQASANQRSGRCGRLGPGIAIRMYDEQDYLSRPPFAQPEIRRCDLAATMLHAKSLGIDDIESLPWLDPPRPDTVREGQNTLIEIGAIDQDGGLSSAGRQLARWPVSPRIGRMLLAAEEHGCLHEMLIIASALETQDPRVRPVEYQQDADAAHLRFRDFHSDFLGYLRLWDFYQSLRSQLGRGRLERACRDNFLSLARLREWGDVHRQLAEQCREAHLHAGPRRWFQDSSPCEQPAQADPKQKESPENRFPEGYEPIHLSILSGLLSGVAMLDDQGRYRGASNMELQLWPGSGLRGTKPKWIVCAELVETTQRFARTVARIDNRWIERIGAHCIHYAYDSPHFSRNQGSAMVMRRGTLFGLPAVPRVGVPLAPLDPALARSLLIEHGLAERELVSRARFWKQNQQFLDELRKIGDRTRRRDCVADPFQLLAFYRNCIPDHVVDRVTLEQWDRQLPREPIAPPFLNWSDLAAPVDIEAVDRDFPDRLTLGVSQLPLQYSFEPGEESDGVTVRVPDRLVDQLHREKLEWLVPGLLEEKLVALLKSLPKRLRRQLVPIPDTVRSMLPEMRQSEQQAEPFSKALCNACARRLDEPIRPDDFDLDSLPPHLRMRIELIDSSGKSTASARDLNALKRPLANTPDLAPSTEPAIAPSYAWRRDAMPRWDIESLPASVVETIGGVRLERYPTLRCEGGKISTVLVDHPQLAEQMLREGWIRLCAQAERREIKSQIQFLPSWSQASIWVSDRWSGDQWSEWIGWIMARLALVEWDWSKGRDDFAPSIRTRLDYDTLAVDRIKRIGLAAAEIGRWLPKFAAAYQIVRKSRESLPASAGPSRAAIDDQLSALLDGSHAFHTPWVYLREFPRYLNAIATRLEKLRAIGTLKDMELDRLAIDAWNDFSQRMLKESPAHLRPSGKLLEYRWMIEEFRVSLHAQKLGTRISVSPKRLEKLREQWDRGLDT
jgi:ATP-dependent helicase HrpA